MDGSMTPDFIQCFGLSVFRFAIWFSFVLPITIFFQVAGIEADIGAAFDSLWSGTGY